MVGHRKDDEIGGAGQQIGSSGNRIHCMAALVIQPGGRSLTWWGLHRGEFHCPGAGSSCLAGAQMEEEGHRM